MPGQQNEAGQVLSLYRYPVKSMQGEQLGRSEVTRMGLAGDRVYALVDNGEGRVGTARNARKWPGLFQFSAALIDDGVNGGSIPPVRISLPGGAITTSGQDDCNHVLSEALRRQVTLRAVSEVRGRLIADGEDHPPGQQTDDSSNTSGFRLPEGNFFDAAVIHLLTTASLKKLAELYPQGRIEPLRFRPNILINTGDQQTGFIENEWLGRTVTIGNGVRLRITAACGRCVMTTLQQRDLPADPGILRTIAQNNKGKFGVYAEVLQAGTVREGDSICLE